MADSLKFTIEVKKNEVNLVKKFTNYYNLII